MKRLVLAFASTAALLVAALGSAASAAGPPVVKEHVKVVDVPFTDDGIDCGNGLPAVFTGRFSGVLHTVVLGNGSVHFHLAASGSVSVDDLPVDDISEGTSEFRNTISDVFLPNGREVHTLTLHGLFVAAGTGAEHRFHVVITLVLDADGTPIVDHLRLECDAM